MMNRTGNDFSLLSMLLRQNGYGMYGAKFSNGFYQSIARAQRQNAELMAKVDSLYSDEFDLGRRSWKKPTA